MMNKTANIEHKFRSAKSSRRISMTRRGGMVVLIALLLPVILMLVGFSVDLANMQRVRTELRAATDLASKAAAHALSVADNGDVNFGMQSAVDSGKAVALANSVGGEPLVLEDSDFTFGRSVEQGNGRWAFTPGVTPPNSVRVTGRRSATSPDGGVLLHFGMLYGQRHFEPTATATSSFRKVDICLVLDRSSSMKLAVDDTAGLLGTSNPRTCNFPYSDSRWVALETAVNIFLDRLVESTADEAVALVTFAGGTYAPCGETNTAVSTDQDLSWDVDNIRTAMQNRSTSIWNGMTEIDRGIDRAYSLLTGPSSRTNAEKVMIVLTDGVYTGDDPVPSAATAHASGITVHTITFSNGANQADMQAVASTGGGASYHAVDAATLNDIFTKLAGTITILTE